MIEVNIKQEVFIHASEEKIFTYLGDLENLVDWSSCVISMRHTTAENTQVGATAQGTIRFLGKWSEIAFEIIERESARTLTIKSLSGISPCLFCYQLASVEGQGTTLSQEAIIHIMLGKGETEQIVTNAVHRQLEYDLLTLKDILEASASR